MNEVLVLLPCESRGTGRARSSELPVCTSLSSGSTQWVLRKAPSVDRKVFHGAGVGQ